MSKANISKKIDPRIRRTRRLLSEAIVSLLMEKDYGSITIRDITNRADVAYITFYRHFESLDDLLMVVLDEGLAELQGHIETLAKQSEGNALETEGRLIFEYIEQKADLFQILLKSQSVIRIRKKVLRNIALVFQKACAPLANCDNRVTVNLLSNHIATSLLALIEWWLENNRTPSPAKMGKVYKSLIIDSTVGTMRLLPVLAK